MRTDEEPLSQRLLRQLAEEYQEMSEDALPQGLHLPLKLAKARVVVAGVLPPGPGVLPVEVGEPGPWYGIRRKDGSVMGWSRSLEGVRDLITEQLDRWSTDDWLRTVREYAARSPLDERLLRQFPEEHHPSCRPHDVSLMWVCEQCGLRTPASETLFEIGLLLLPEKDGEEKAGDTTHQAASDGPDEAVLRIPKHIKQRMQREQPVERFTWGDVQDRIRGVIWPRGWKGPDDPSWAVLLYAGWSATGDDRDDAVVAYPEATSAEQAAQAYARAMPRKDGAEWANVRTWRDAMMLSGGEVLAVLELDTQYHQLAAQPVGLGEDQ